MVFCSIKESLAPFTQERTHKYWNGSLPILRQWWFTQQSISALKTNRHEFTQKAGAVAPKEACWYTMMMSAFSRCLHGVPPVNQTPSLGGTKYVFWGKVHWHLGWEDWPLRWFISITNTRWVKGIFQCKFNPRSNTPWHRVRPPFERKSLRTTSLRSFSIRNDRTTTIHCCKWIRA